MIDGEIVALDEDGQPSFNVLQNFGSPKGPLLYYAFTGCMSNQERVAERRKQRNWRHPVTIT